MDWTSFTKKQIFTIDWKSFGNKIIDKQQIGHPLVKNLY